MNAPPLRSVDVYVDESGDLGFGRGGSKFFIISAMVTTDSVKMERFVKKMNLRYKQRDKGGVEFKFNRSQDGLRMRFVETIGNSDCSIFWKAVRKDNVQEPLRVKKDKLYHYICGQVLADIFRHTYSESFTVTFDRRSSKRTVRNDLDRYVEQQMFLHHTGIFPPKLRVSHFDSCNCPCLQVQDFVVGSVFQSLERGDDGYIERFQSKINPTSKIMW
ncbi:MAG TPA: DUF3800 domain-containing protein [Methanomassiliicoccales archaeon]|nr:DUF3800 domain-containing protein [Methanomassiliicoccales archaeon]